MAIRTRVLSGWGGIGRRVSKGSSRGGFRFLCLEEGPEPGFLLDRLGFPWLRFAFGLGLRRMIRLFIGQRFLVGFTMLLDEIRNL